MDALTRRQREVAALLAEGLTNREIAGRLVISERTVEGHVEQIRLKLGLRTRSQIVAAVLSDRPPRRTADAFPEIRYATSSGVHIAYQVLGGDGPDLLEVLDAVLPIDSMHEEPALARFQQRLASFSRLIRFDIRGVGMSDPVVASEPPTLEQWAEDAIAVLDSGRVDPGGRLRAARHLVAHGDDGSDPSVTGPGHGVLQRHGVRPSHRRLSVGPAAESDRLVSQGQHGVGHDRRGFDYLRLVAPTIAGDEGFREWWTRAGNRGASPATARAIQKVYLYADVRPLLPAVQATVLVLHRKEIAELPGWQRAVPGGTPPRRPLRGATRLRRPLLGG